MANTSDVAFTWDLLRNFETFQLPMNHTQGPASPSMTWSLQRFQELKPLLCNSDWTHEAIVQMLQQLDERFPVHQWIGEAIYLRSHEKKIHFLVWNFGFNPKNVLNWHEYLHLIIIVRGIRSCYPCNLSNARCNWNLHFHSRMCQKFISDQCVHRG